MQVYRARARYLRVSPTKIRPVVNLVRGHRASRVIEWLRTKPSRRTTMILKALGSAIANAVDLSGAKSDDYKIVVAKVDNGPTYRYAIPGAMGRSVIRRRRLSHLEIGVAPIGKSETNVKEVDGGTEG